MPTLLTGAPRVVLQEQVIGATSNEDTAYGAMAFGSAKGPTSPTFTSSTAAWTSTYGNTDLNWSYAGLCSKAFLNKGPGLWNIRVTNTDAYYGSTFLVVDLNNAGDSMSTGSATIPTFNNINVTTSHLYYEGPNTGVSSGFTIRPAAIGSNIPDTSPSITFTLTVSGAVNSTSTFTASPNSTATTVATWLDPIYTALATALDSLDVEYGFQVLSSGHYFVYIQEGYTVTLSLSDTTSVEVVSLPFLQVFARDPGGTYANNYYGASLSNFSTGRSQVVQLRVLGTMASSDYIDARIKYGALSIDVSTKYTTSQQATITAFATALTEAATEQGMPISFATADSSGNPSTTNVAMVIATSTEAGKNAFTATTTSNFVSVYNANSGADDSETFTFSVYSVSNLNTPLETFVASFNVQTDANGTQQFIEDVVNGGNGLSGSSYVRVFVGNLASTYQPSYLGLTVPSLPSTYAWLEGGDDGSLPTDSQIAAAWDKFLDTETYSLNLLINCGYTDPSVQMEMVNTADTREDSIAILDMPMTITDAQTAANYRNNSINTVSSRAGLYMPYVKVTDSVTNRNVWCPPSGHVAAQFAYTRTNYGSYNAPAGAKRGVLSGVTDVYTNFYEEGDLDLLDAAQINYIRKIGGAIEIDNDRTLIDNNGPLSSMNIRVMLNDIEAYAVSVARGYKFDLDNENMMTAIEKDIDKYLDIYVTAGAISDKAVICDGSNNGAIYLDNAQCNISIYLIGVKATRYFLVGVGVGTNAVGIAEMEASGIV